LRLTAILVDVDVPGHHGAPGVFSLAPNLFRQIGQELVNLGRIDWFGKMMVKSCRFASPDVFFHAIPAESNTTQ
jgi:hypothetical protein